MIREYIDSAMKHAHYELIDDEEPYYGKIKAAFRENGRLKTVTSFNFWAGKSK